MAFSELPPFHYFCMLSGMSTQTIKLYLHPTYLSENHIPGADTGLDVVVRLAHPLLPSVVKVFHELLVIVM